MEKWLVRVDFIDHADCPAPISGTVPITVWGVVVKDTDSEIHLLKWCANRDEKDSNSETWAIVKHPGIKIEKIRKEFL